MRANTRIGLAVMAAGVMFAGGWAAGQHRFGAPETIVHLSIIKWKAGIPDAERAKALDGVKAMAAAIPGIRNVWIRAIRVQPQGYHDAFAIEFENQAAADRYVSHPVHAAWTEHFQSIREASISPQITN